MDDRNKISRYARGRHQGRGVEPAGQPGLAAAGISERPEPRGVGRAGQHQGSDGAPLGSLDWPPQGLLSGLNLGVLDALDDTKAVTSRLLGDLDWPPFLAIPNPAPVCPKRQRSVHRFGEPENPLDVCHHHDILDAFDNQITFTGLVRCTRELFAGGHYSLAVEKAFVYVENLVKKRSGVSGKYGSNLMKTVFSVQNPFIKLNAGVTDSDRDEQLGYMEVFAGAMTGIRNPRAHAHDWIDEPKEALELLVFANPFGEEDYDTYQLAKSKVNLDRR